YGIVLSSSLVLIFAERQLADHGCRIADGQESAHIRIPRLCVHRPIISHEAQPQLLAILQAACLQSSSRRYSIAQVSRSDDRWLPSSCAPDGFSLRELSA